MRYYLDKLSRVAQHMTRVNTEQNVDFSSMSEKDIQQTLNAHNLALTAHEALCIQTMQQRPPTLSELVLWSIQASEHCAYKSSKIHLKTLVTDGPNVILGAKEDAGVIHIATDKQGERYGLVISHESHNHPSQVVPKEGAATGVGGNVRDVSCMGAEVIAMADSLRFGCIDSPKTKWLQKGVVDGIASYANPIGVPNIAGDISFHNSYQDNCLVTVVTLGTVKEADIVHSYAPNNAAGHDLILVGKPTDMSGFGGASFASLTLNEQEQEQNRGAVQEPNAFLGRMLLKSNLELFKRLRQKNLIDQVGFKDLGAGGVACASIELADHVGMGAEVILDHVHTAMDNLPPSVILCSETQERYMWVCPPDLTPMILSHYNEHFALPSISTGACARVIGKITAGNRYRVSYQGKILVDAKAADITQGIQYDRPTQKTEKPKGKAKPLPKNLDLNALLLALLQHENIAATTVIDEQYDKQVQGRTIIERNQHDAGVIAPFNNKDYPQEIQQIGVALAVACNPRLNAIDPFYGAYHAVVDVLCKLAATGATPEALTDCLCYGNPENPAHMSAFVEGIRGLKFAAENIPLKSHRTHPVPIVAGNVSFYNESEHQAISPSPMISAVGTIANIQHTTCGHFHSENAVILLLGERKPSLAGSVFFDLLDINDHALPKPDPTAIATQIYALTDAIEQGFIEACRYITHGGLGTTLAKMSFLHEVGVQVTLAKGQPLAEALFSEAPGFVMTITPENLSTVLDFFHRRDVHCQAIGRTTQHNNMVFDDRLVVPLQAAKRCWQQGLREKFS